MVAAAALFAVATTVRSSPYPGPVIIETSHNVAYGLSPSIEFALPRDRTSLSLIYVTRWKSQIYQSRGKLDEFLSSDGKVDLELLMSLGSPPIDQLPELLIDQMSDEFNSIVVLRDDARRRDTIFAFNQVGLVKSGQVQTEEVSWRHSLGIEYVSVMRPPRSTIIFLGGTDGSVDHQALGLWAAGGVKVISLPWVQVGTRTAGCLDRVDLNVLQEKIEQTYKANSGVGPVSLVGYSGGADAALMIANRSTIPLHSVHAIAPTAWHFNGSNGLGCAFPASPWIVDNEQVPYILNFPLIWSTPVALLRRAAGGLSQNTLAVEALKHARPAKRAAIMYDVSDIKSRVYLYGGGLDDLTPSAMSIGILCKMISDVRCYVNPFAGHDIFGSPAGSVFCQSPREALNGIERRRYCRETASARRHIFESIAEVTTAA